MSREAELVIATHAPMWAWGDPERYVNLKYFCGVGCGQIFDDHQQWATHLAGLLAPLDTATCPETEDN